MTQKLGKSVGVVLSALTEDVTVSATGTVSVPKASRVYRLGAVRNVAIARGAKKTLRLKISKKARTAIARALKAKKRVKATIRISARDASGNVATAKRTIRLKR